MLFKFLILSDEVDDFSREIQIDAEATFMDLHDIILDSVGYTKDQMCSFFICDEDWSKRTEVTFMEMDTSSEEDSFIMNSTRLEELLEEEDQKVLFVFDYMTERAFFMELVEIIPGKDLDEAVCCRSEGLPPTQFISFDEFEVKSNSLDFGEDFYGDSEYNIDELDESGFEGLETPPVESSFEDERF